MPYSAAPPTSAHRMNHIESCQPLTCKSIPHNPSLRNHPPNINSILRKPYRHGKVYLKDGIDPWAYQLIQRRHNAMGVYLNSETARTLYKNEAQKPYFIDKSLLLEELFPFVKEGSNYICITRPRRFGKTVMANMIAAFFSNAHDTADIFGKLQISKRSGYQTYLNRYPVIHIPLNDITRQCASYEQYITRIETRLIRDLKKAYPHIEPERQFLNPLLFMRTCTIVILNIFNRIQRQIHHPLLLPVIGHGNSHRIFRLKLLTIGF